MVPVLLVSPVLPVPPVPPALVHHPHVKPSPQRKKLGKFLSKDACCEATSG